MHVPYSIEAIGWISDWRTMLDIVGLEPIFRRPCMLKSTLPRLGQTRPAGAAYSKVWSTTIKIPGLTQTNVPSTVPHIHNDLEEASSLVLDMLTQHKGRTLIMTGAGKYYFGV